METDDLLNKLATLESRVNGILATLERYETAATSDDGPLVDSGDVEGHVRVMAQVREDLNGK